MEIMWFKKPPTTEDMLLDLYQNMARMATAQLEERKQINILIKSNTELRAKVWRLENK